MTKKIFITGIAGFIGFHLALALKQRGDCVIGCDNFNTYYDPGLKKERAKLLEAVGITVFDSDIRSLQLGEKMTHFVHLAAQAGVRYSIENPASYVSNNLDGFFHVLELCRKNPTMKLIYASSSSVYGLNKKTPFSESDITDHPASFYGSTKKANELMAHSYHHLFGIPVTGLRFFTVYGPWGRPDMAYYSFTRSILEEKPIPVFHGGNTERDFTYIDDIVKGVIAAIDLGAACEIFNLGNHHPESVLTLIALIEKFTGKTAIKEFLPTPPGDIVTTYADISKAQTHLGFSPSTSLEQGMEHFVNWFLTLDFVHF